MTELVIVMIVSVILAAFAAARISTQAFDTEGFANQTIAMVRYAQKIAISQRRTVAVVVTTGTPGTVRICYTDTACSGGDVAEPAGGAFTKTSKTNVTVATLGFTGSKFSFDALGKPSEAGTITISGDGSHTVTIEAETGYVH